MINFQQNYEFHHNDKFQILVMNFPHNDEISSQWIIFITIMNFHYSGKFQHWSVLVPIDA